MFSVAEKYFLFFFRLLLLFSKYGYIFDLSIKNNKVMTTTTTQKNLYIMLDSCGRTITKANEYGTQSPEWIEASNVKDASKTARELYGSKVWKVQRCYNGGVRG